MKKNILKRFVAYTLTGAMVCSICPPISMANVNAAGIDVSGDATKTASGNASGEASIEGIIDKDVFHVVIPTTPVNTDVFSFTLDPQDLIKSAGGSDTTYVSTSGVYFKHSADNKYYDESDTVTVTNKGSIPVSVSATAKLSNLASGDASIKLASTDTFASGDATASLYMGLKVSGDAATETKAIADDGVTVTASMDAVAASNFNVTGDSINGYKYTLDASTPESAFQSKNISLVGACNMDKASIDAWDAVKDVKPTVNVTWTLEALNDAAPAAPAAPTSDGTTDITITYSGTKPTAGTLSFTRPDGSTWTPASSAYTSNIKIADTTLTLRASWLKSIITNSGAGTYSVTINGTEYEFNLTE